MNVRAPELGHLYGVFVPALEVQAHEACGWVILDDMAVAQFANDEVLMAPPQAAQREAA